MTFRSAPKPVPRAKPKRKPLPRATKRIAKVSARWDRTWWPRRSRECIEAASALCYNCRPRRVRANQSAHVHELGRGRSRNNPDATCSACGTRLNDLANLRAVCSASCNAAVARPCPGRSR